MKMVIMVIVGLLVATSPVFADHKPFKPSDCENVDWDEVNAEIDVNAKNPACKDVNNHKVRTPEEAAAGCGLSTAYEIALKKYCGK